jgi:hypothetical protein
LCGNDHDQWAAAKRAAIAALFARTALWDAIAPVIDVGATATEASRADSTHRARR